MEIAETLAGLPENPLMKIIMDRSANIYPVLDNILESWSHDLYNRRPAPAYRETGEFKGTDLDMATFMIALANRNAVINLPEYEGRREKIYKSNEWVISSENRHGKIIGLTGNKHVFSFSVRILDFNILNLDTGELGVPRNYLLTDLDAELYGGFDRIEFVADAKENDFIFSKSDYARDDTVIFKYFTHPNTWCSFYGHWYDLDKAALKRGTEEASYYRTKAKALMEDKDIWRDWIKLIKSKTKGERYRQPAEIVRVPGHREKVVSFLAEIDFPMNGEYPKVDYSAEGLEEARSRASHLSYSILPKLRFVARAAEQAFYSKGRDGKNRPGWSVPEWQRNIKPAGSGNFAPRNVLDYENGITKSYRTRIITESVR